MGREGGWWREETGCSREGHNVHDVHNVSTIVCVCTRVCLNECNSWYGFAGGYKAYKCPWKSTYINLSSSKSMHLWVCVFSIYLWHCAGVCAYICGLSMCVFYMCIHLLMCKYKWLSKWVSDLGDVPVCKFNFDYLYVPSWLTCLEGLYWETAFLDYSTLKVTNNHNFVNHKTKLRILRIWLYNCPWQYVTHLRIYSMCVCVYLNKAEAAEAACVATSRQEEETPATTTSETATNPGALGNRRTLGGCLYTHINTHTQDHAPQKLQCILSQINKCHC